MSGAARHARVSEWMEQGEISGFWFGSRCADDESVRLGPLCFSVQECSLGDSRPAGECPRHAWRRAFRVLARVRVVATASVTGRRPHNSAGGVWGERVSDMSLRYRTNPRWMS
jgi:hypothetical protein